MIYLKFVNVSCMVYILTAAGPEGGDGLDMCGEGEMLGRGVGEGDVKGEGNRMLEIGGLQRQKRRRRHLEGGVEHMLSRCGEVEQGV